MLLFILDFEGDFLLRIMSQFVVPNWNLRHQRQDQVDEGEGINNRSFHVQNQQYNPSYVVPMSRNHEVTELTWENGQLSMHGLSNIIPSPAAPTKAAAATAACGSRPSDHTLESIVHQATCHHKHNLNLNLTNIMMQSQKNDQQNNTVISSSIKTATTGGKGGENNAGQVQMLLPPNKVKKRVRTETESDQCGRYLNNNNSSNSSRRLMNDLGTERSACASASATFCRDNNKDTTMMTWASFESPGSLKTKTTDDDSASHGGLEIRDEEQETKGGTIRTCSARRSRAAAIHNQSERRRRDRINQKMKALQKLVPNASKTDKASMLDEVIEYLKQLQAQLQMMSSSTRTMPHQMMMNPALAMQQQLQMSLLARSMGMSSGVGVGVGMGLGMIDVNAMPRTAPSPHHSLQSLMHSTPIPSTTPTTFCIPPPFLVPPTIPVSAAATTAASTSAAGGPFNHPYSAFLAQQTANMEFYGKMAALYRQQANQTTTNVNPMLPNFNQGK